MRGPAAARGEHGGGEERDERGAHARDSAQVAGGRPRGVAVVRGVCSVIEGSSQRWVRARAVVLGALALSPRRVSSLSLGPNRHSVEVVARRSDGAARAATAADSLPSMMQ